MSASDSALPPERELEAAPRFPVPERPPLPRPERVNRNALTIVAVAIGTLVLAAVVFVQPGRPNGAAPPVPPPTAAEPTFLDQPAHAATGRVAPPGAFAPGATSATSEIAPPGDLTNGTTAVPPVTGDAPRSWDLSARAPVVRAEDPDVVAYRAAVAAPLRPHAAIDPNVPAIDGADPNAVLPQGPMVAPNAQPSVDGRWGKQRGFLQDIGASDPTRATRTMLTPAPGPYAIQAGTMIPAVLLTEIDSDLPGDVLAQVAHDVYDSRAEETLLIPKGARLLGTYDSDISSNQRRLFVAWTRIIYPDGRSLALPGLETKDQSGAGGVADRVEHHRRRTFGVAALLSLVGAGAQLAQPNGGYSAAGSYPSVGQVAAGAAGQQLSQVATEMLRKQMDVAPTIRIRQGMPFQVFLRTDLVFPGPYERDRAP